MTDLPSQWTWRREVSNSCFSSSSIMTYTPTLTHSHTPLTHTCHHTRVADKHTWASDHLIIFIAKQRLQSLFTWPLNYANKKLGQIKRLWQIADIRIWVSTKNYGVTERDRWNDQLDPNVTSTNGLPLLFPPLVTVYICHLNVSCCGKDSCVLPSLCAHSVWENVFSHKSGLCIIIYEVIKERLIFMTNKLAWISGFLLINYLSRGIFYEEFRK
jgi:hypothetical protein